MKGRLHTFITMQNCYYSAEIKPCSTSLELCTMCETKVGILEKDLKYLVVSRVLIRWVTLSTTLENQELTDKTKVRKITMEMTTY